jgi:hypothetical protein
MKRRSSVLLLMLWGLSTPYLAAAKPDLKANEKAKVSIADWAGIWISAQPIADVGIDGYPKWKSSSHMDWKVFGFGAPYNDATKAKLMQSSPGERAVFKQEAWGFPFMMESPTPLQFLITPQETLIINFYRDVRHIYTDGRQLPAPNDRWPTPWGESIGYWENDTLVIKTIAVERPGFMLGQLLVSNEAEYVERIRMVNPNRIELEMTIVDPATLKEPWVIQVAFKRADGFDRMFHHRFNNDRTVLDDDGKNFTIGVK